MSVSELHKVERKTLIRAHRSRVWRALTNVAESGFDRLSEARRSRVIAQNEAGWQFQIAALEKYLG